MKRFMIGLVLGLFIGTAGLSAMNLAKEKTNPPVLKNPNLYQCEGRVYGDDAKMICHPISEE